MADGACTTDEELTNRYDVALSARARIERTQVGGTIGPIIRGADERIFAVEEHSSFSPLRHDICIVYVD